MSSACSVPRLVRCRVRDLASCFYACRFPLEEEQESPCSKPPKTPNKCMVLNSKHGHKDHEPRKKTSTMKKTNNEGGESVQSSSRYNSSKRFGLGGLEPSFAEEDYIVFCFEEDGAIHMIDECKSSSPQKFHENTDPNTVTTKTSSHRSINNKKDDKDDYEEIKDTNPLDDDDDDDDDDEQQQDEQKIESFESCDSNLSDRSSTSFAFPVLSIEWMGSPVHMPKAENQHQHMCLHCCRF